MLRGSAGHSQMVLSTGLEIDPDGTVAGVVDEGGTTSSLLENHSGSVEVPRNGSVLVGAGYVLTHNLRTAGIPGNPASHVTISGLNIAGAENGIYLCDARGIDIAANHGTMGDTAIRIDGLTSVPVSNEDWPRPGDSNNGRPHRRRGCIGGQGLLSRR